MKALGSEAAIQADIPKLSIALLVFNRPNLQIRAVFNGFQFSILFGAR